MQYIDTILVVAYFVVIFVISLVQSRKYSGGDDGEFLTGGHHLNWKQTALTLIAMMFDPGIMGISALAFVWGFYVVQWNAVNIWLTCWFAGMFFVGIFWKSKIITTPEYLEKRFNALSRGFFSFIMVAMLVSLLAYAIYMGGILLNKFLGWDIMLSSAVLAFVAGFYVIVGGVRTMLKMDIIQGVLLLVTLLAVGVAGIIELGGISGMQELTAVGKAGTPLKSIIPPMDFSLESETYFPLPAVLTFAVIAGLSWIICNFSMAQRLLASKNEEHAQKALIVAGIFNVFVFFLAYWAGVAVRAKMPDVQPDEAFMHLLLNFFPNGIKGLLLVGLIAALLSTVDGLIASSSTLLTFDIFQRFVNKNASEKTLKYTNRVIQFVIVASVFVIIPTFLEDDGSAGGTPAYEIVQKFLGDIFGVLIAIYILGVFFQRTTGRASFVAMIIGIVVGLSLDILTDFNFAYIGTIQFLSVLFFGVALSYLEPAPNKEDIENLTIWSIPGVKGPWIGLHSWKGLKYAAIGLPMVWLVFTLCWEFVMSK